MSMNMQFELQIHSFEMTVILPSCPHMMAFPISISQFWVGMMLTRQPFFVGGIEDVQLARSSAFGSCYMYCATFGISLVITYRDTRKKRRNLILARQQQNDAMTPLQGFRDIELPASVTDSEFAFGSFT